MIVAGAEVGDLDLACTIVEARVQKCMREGATGEWRGSRAAVPMAPRVRSVVIEATAREWRRRPWDKDLELEEKQCGWRIEMEAEMATCYAFMWPSYYHKCPCLKSMAW